MGATNFGNQTIVFKYKNPSTSKSFNNLLYNVLPVGVYKGGTLTIVNNTTVRCSVVSVFIADDVEKVAVKCETSQEFDLPITTVQNYLILRLDWISSENNFIDAINVSEGEIRDTDIILGRGVYDGITLISIDTSVKTIPRSVIDSVDSPQLKDASVIDSKIGLRVINQNTEVPYSNSGLYNNIINWFAKRIKAILGTEHWFSDVPVTLTETMSHIDNTLTMHGATSDNDSNTLVIRDENGDFSARNITANRLIGKADALTTARAISLSGDAVGSINFDGSNDVDIDVKVQVKSHSHVSSDITDLRLAVLNIAHPIGEVYVQYPNKPSPNTLYPGTTWAKVTGLEGRFFRNEGGNANAFGGLQYDAIIQHSHAYYTTRARDESEKKSDTIGWGNPNTPSFSGNGGGIGYVMGVTATNETRPINATVILWERLA